MKHLVIFLLACGVSASAQQQPQPAPVAGPDQPQIQPGGVPAAQVQQQPQPAQSPEPQHIVLRVVGSQVRNHAGERLGLIEEVLVNRANGAVEYAVVSPQYPTNSARQTPVPWSALSYAWDQSRAGGPPGANQIFIVNIDPRRLATAPTFDRTRTGMDQALANAGNFFGQSQPAGATGTTGGAVTGAGTATPVVDPGVATAPPLGGSGVTVGVPADNQVTIPGQRSTVQPGGDNRLPPPEQRVPHANNGVAPRLGGQSPNAPSQGVGAGARPGGTATGGSRGGSSAGSGGSTGSGAGGGASGGSTGGSSGSGGGGASGGGAAGR